VTSQPATTATGSKHAVLYLRVSSSGQVKTDYDPEGISIPAQREVCQRKAHALGLEVVGEYVEPGRSATSMDKRIAFQEMLTRIRTERDVDHVIVYKLSRMNRNRVEDALVMDRLRKHGVALISATEAIDNSRNGQLLHGILAAINEFRSAEDGADIRDKMGYKARSGGTLSKAPLGYKNVRVEFDGRLVNTVALDADRAPLVRKAWELYASGDYSLDTLSSVMADQGLLTRPTRRWPSQPVSVNKLSQMLRDPYYLGKITYQGELYDGRHQPIVDQALFDRVQDILDARSQRGTRNRVHHHYLKGMLRCARCDKQGRSSRLIYTEARSRNGTLHGYYKCRSRQDHICDLPHLPAWQLEESIERSYQWLQLDQAFLDDLAAKLEATLADEQRMTRELAANLRTELTRLDAREERLLDLAADDSLPTSRLKQRLRDLALERERIQQSLQDTSSELAAGAAVLRDAIQLVRDPHQLYCNASDEARRPLNAAFNHHFLCDDHGQVTAVLQPPFDELRDAESLYLRRHATRRRGHTGHTTKPHSGYAEVRQTNQNTQPVLAGVYSVRGWNKRVMVELRGFEPLAPSMRTRCATGLRHSPQPVGKITSRPSGSCTGRRAGKASTGAGYTARRIARSSYCSST
jgi:site-specific DNA recombinase